MADALHLIQARVVASCRWSSPTAACRSWSPGGDPEAHQRADEADRLTGRCCCRSRKPRLACCARAPDAEERVALADAAGRVLADPRIVAAVDVPPFANSSMDGFALRAADAPGVLRVAGEIAAGAGSLQPVEAGLDHDRRASAPGADAVVLIEDVAESDGVVSVPSPVTPGAFVRSAAHDTRAGDVVLLAGPLPAEAGDARSLGIGEVASAASARRDPLDRRRARRPRRPTPSGQIHDANGPSLAAAVIEAGGEPRPGAVVGDDPEAIERTLRAAAASADLVVTSGGVSVGRHDHVRTVLERRRALDFWRIAVQPGKPLAIGELDGTTIIGCPAIR